MTNSIFKQTPGYNFKKLFVEGYNHLTVDGQKWSLPLRERAMVGAFAKALNAPKYLNRVRLKRKLAARGQACATMRDGYALCDGDSIPGLAEALAVCDLKLDTYLKYKAGRSDFLERFNPEKYHEELAKTDGDALRHVPYRHDPAAAVALLRPFLSPAMYLTAAEHLGLLPVLTSVRIVYSPNEDIGRLRSSQLFHVDPEGERQVKVFVAVNDVSQDNSPLTFIPEHQTLELLDTGEPVFVGRRLKDHKLAKRVPKSEWVSHIGPPGQTVFLDTSRCFHCGSRPAPKPRLLLYAQYLDPYSSQFAAAERLRRRLAGGFGYYQTDDPVEQYLLSRR